MTTKKNASDCSQCYSRELKRVQVRRTNDIPTKYLYESREQAAMNLQGKRCNCTEAA